MFPPGLKGPELADFRDAPPSEAPPADYPSRLPFLSNQAVSYAESEDMAGGVWPVLPAGQAAPDKSTRAPRPPGLRGAVTGLLDGVDMAVAMLQPDPAAKAQLDDLFERVLAAAAGSGWTLEEAAPMPIPVGSRHAALRRAGDRLRLLGALTPKGSSIVAWAFRDQAP